MAHRLRRRRSRRLFAPDQRDFRGQRRRAGRGTGDRIHPGQAGHRRHRRRLADSGKSRDAHRHADALLLGNAHVIGSRPGHSNGAWFCRRQPLPAKQAVEVERAHLRPAHPPRSNGFGSFESASECSAESGASLFAYAVRLLRLPVRSLPLSPLPSGSNGLMQTPRGSLAVGQVADRISPQQAQSFANQTGTPFTQAFSNGSVVTHQPAVSRVPAASTFIAPLTPNPIPV